MNANLLNCTITASYNRHISSQIAGYVLNLMADIEVTYRNGSGNRCLENIQDRIKCFSVVYIRPDLKILEE